MIFAHSSLIQEGESVLFYRYNRILKGYMINGLFIAPNLKAKLAFAKVWKYFVSEIVRAGDIYCSIPLEREHTMFTDCLEYYDTIQELKIYKVDNFLKEQYSTYEKHIKIVNKRVNL